MSKKKIKKIIAATGVIGGVICMNTTLANATENEGILPVDPQTENLNFRSSYKGQVVNVDGTYLRIRSLPSTESEILGTMIESTKFDIVSQEGSWYKIQYNNISGYVHSDYVEEVKSLTEENTLYYGKVYNADLNLRVRSSASLNASIIGYVVDNETVSIVGREGDWYKIKYNSGYGYVHGDYILTNDVNPSNPNEEIEMNKTGYAYNLDGSTLRVRTGPSTDSSVVGALYEGEAVSIISDLGSWYKIYYNNSYAYASKDYITLDNSSSSGGGSTNVVIGHGTVINVEGSNLRVRQSASTDSYVLGYLLNNSSVDILANEGNWYKILFNDSIGYVSADYISLNGGSSGGNNQGSSNVSAYNTVLEVLKAQIGSPYVWGGAGEYLTTSFLNELKSRFPYETSEGEYSHSQQFVDQGYRAFDCSGLMQWGFKQAGIYLGRTTYNQIYDGVEVSLDSVQPGDLLFTHDLGHVGMYVGNNQWLHSAFTGDTVKISNFSWSSIGRARRVL